MSGVGLQPKAGMPFRKNSYYMHKRQLDVCFLVEKVSYIGHNYVVLKGTYVNLGYDGKPWPIPSPRNIKIYSNEYDNYVRLTEEQLNTPRKHSGLPD